MQWWYSSSLATYGNLTVKINVTGNFFSLVVICKGWKWANMWLMVLTKWHRLFQGFPCAVVHLHIIAKWCTIALHRITLHPTLATVGKQDNTSFLSFFIFMLWLLQLLRIVLNGKGSAVLASLDGEVKSNQSGLSLTKHSVKVLYMHIQNTGHGKIYIFQECFSLNPFYGLCT